MELNSKTELQHMELELVPSSTKELQLEPVLSNKTLEQQGLVPVPSSMEMIRQREPEPEHSMELELVEGRQVLVQHSMVLEPASVHNKELVLEPVRNMVQELEPVHSKELVPVPVLVHNMEPEPVLEHSMMMVQEQHSKNELEQRYEASNRRIVASLSKTAERGA